MATKKPAKKAKAKVKPKAKVKAKATSKAKATAKAKARPAKALRAKSAAAVKGGMPKTEPTAPKVTPINQTLPTPITNVGPTLDKP
jgi:hypothetical protein